MVKRIEASIQRALVDWIKNNHSEIMMQATLNENSRHAMDMGCTAGIPDLLLFRRAEDVLHVMFLELKTTQGKLSKPQTEWVRDDYDVRLKSSNTHYAVAYGFSDAKKEVMRWVCA